VAALPAAIAFFASARPALATFFCFSAAALYLFKADIF
jgi:hypothetical protein